MKTIILVRHGKSSWKYDVGDRQRPLKTRGLNDIKLVAKEYIKFGELPEKIFSSPAKRAYQTCKIFIKTCELDQKEVTIIEELYDFNGRNVINFIKSLEDTINSIMIFGHNHAFTSISNIFGDRFIENLPTSGLVKINFEIDNWKSLEKGKTELIIVPKDLR
ncbi:SixA phosphatase family protein [Winogradskyella vincentii]|uniref:Histidine phosphatase family protein n=1 Tax=Winogradskyella vincentii TaxID=2877122 RepID=A0ABS7Y002_9FLAO|nr:histidine phosphatase family protein [Winogradskyella vincentii]MCA0153251.1 histidine phosphatase family protein [Winogradskyella vincentii]